MSYFLGLDIGGTKCAVLLGTELGETVERIEFPTRTDLGPGYALNQIAFGIDRILECAQSRNTPPEAAGISCGGPLDSRSGVVLSPPNLPGWDEVPIVEFVEKRSDLPAGLQNDADACALAEYRFGAGRGCDSMVFLTFGTGLGAGMILNGKLYSGSAGLAGEIGHIRIAEDGPFHYGKAGSLEGYCSGSGLGTLAMQVAAKRVEAGGEVPWYRTCDGAPSMTAAELAGLADSGDRTAIEIFELSGTYLGRGCAILIDLLNIQRIVIGSVFVRCRSYIEPAALREIEREALKPSREMCELVPAQLGERIGDVASLCVAMARAGE